MKLLTLIASADIGGAEMHVDHIVRHVRAEHAVVALADGAMVPRWTRSGAEVIVLPARGKIPLGAVRGLRRILERVEPDVMHTHTPKANLMGALAATGMPRVMTVHGSHEQFRSSRGLPVSCYRLADRWAARAARAVIAVSRADRDELLARGFSAERLRVVPNGVPDPLTRRSADAREILWIGRFSPEKRPGMMVGIADLIDAPLRMIGSGTAPAPATSRLIMEPPRVPLAEVWPGASILVNTSLSEGASLVILEALAAGVPVVAPRVGGNAEIVGDAGLLVAADAGVREFAEAIGKLLSDPPRLAELSRAARARYEAHYRVEQMAAALEALYREADDGS